MKTVVLRVLLSLSTATIASQAPAQSREPEIHLDADTPGATINPNIFGQFAEMLGEGVYGGIWVGPESKIPNVRGIRTDVVQALRALKVPNVRWPGGCYADQYHWRDGVGPTSQRKVRVNASWGDSIEPNTFGTHEFMDFVDQIGSQAYLSVNVGSGTVQEAAAWLEYMTGDARTSLGAERSRNGRKEPWRIKYLGLGNESWGCGGSFAPESYVEKMKPFSAFVQNYNPAQRTDLIKTGTDPMQRIAVAQDLGHPGYAEAVMSAWKARTVPYWNIEGLSLHLYTMIAPLPMVDDSVNFGEKEYAQLLKKTYLMDDMIVEHGAIMDKYDPRKRVAMVIDEWGAWLKPTGKNFLFLRQQNTLRDAVLAAVNLNIFMRHADRVRMTNIAQMVNVIQSMILTEGAKMILTPTYHVFRMYVPFQGAQAVPLSVSAGDYTFGGVTLPRVDATAARGKDGAVWLAVTNIDPSREARVSVTLNGVTARGAVGETLTAGKVNASNSFDAPDAVAPRPIKAAAAGSVLTLQLPAASVSVLKLVQ
ncbi:alpha-N-arabinofuranosidase [Sphingomonas sp. PL-96]|uniref:alpha-N-arabinofuranosidase n=1 Tax=Sphingomonas sp. PL-96 TaxID=2887201 RepID=UPI001E44A44B|nr:alpha-L-arabinofuranosidase C-terminal domain-containing protein [Sphingomonas sp. PL-96]MCC2978250.1 alpha-N-arabinofuranosidase [Sphingomonas sp. PL-96]